jgi:NADPH-dependent curcumin reductase CurA
MSKGAPVSESNRQIVLASRPAFSVEEANFRLVESALPVPGAGQVLIRSRWLSLDPYMRGRITERKSYARPVDIGAVMVGDTAGEVVHSNHPEFRRGDQVVGPLGWQHFGVADGTALRKVDGGRLPLASYLGPVGMPGVTAYVGLYDLCTPRPGETVVVSAAAGAVGSVAGQLAKLRGCRAVGIAGGPDKCRYVVEELGFDACIDYKAVDVKAQMAAALPDGIDCLFENVGGEMFDHLLARMNPFARIALCGLIADFNTADPYGVKKLLTLILNRVKLQGFIVGDHAPRWPVACEELADHVAAGRIKYRETVADGLAAAPAALVGMFKGQNFGKQLVNLHEVEEK